MNVLGAHVLDINFKNITATEVSYVGKIIDFKIFRTIMRIFSDPLFDRIYLYWHQRLSNRSSCAARVCAYFSTRHNRWGRIARGQRRKPTNPIGLYYLGDSNMRQSGHTIFGRNHKLSCEFLSRNDRIQNCKYFQFKYLHMYF